MSEFDTPHPHTFTQLAALLDHEVAPWPAGQVPPLGHWLLFQPAPRQGLLGPDGHPAQAASDLPRRMWAGSRVRFARPIALGVALRRESETIADTPKQGRSGRMRFVTFRHRIWAGDELAVEEEQDIVYREAAGGPASPLAAPEQMAPAPAIARRVCADPVALFRFSALTFNAHRIHYDQPYATAVEGYPGLVVHGPYIATLLMDHYLRHRPAVQVAGFAFRAMRPIFANEPFTLGLEPSATGAELVAIDRHGGLAMQATITA